jgi:tetratricopeptide (TPR) repeat protein
MEEDFEGYTEGEDFQDHLARFMEAQECGRDVFFDASDIADIASYFTEEGDYSQARLALDMARAQHPSSAEVLLAEAKYFMNIEELEKAAKITDEVILSEPFNPDPMILRGAIASRMGRFRDAIYWYKKAIPLCEEDATDIYLDLAFACQYDEDYDQGVYWLKRILEEEPDNEAALFEMLFLFDLKGDLQGYVSFLNEYIDKHPYSDLAWYNLGVTYMKLHKYRKAIDAFGYATLINEHFSPAWHNMANSHINLGQYNKALECFRESILHEPPTAEVYTMMGECCEKLQRFETAMEYYQEAVSLNGEHADAWIGMGVVLGMQGNLDAAILMAEKGLELEMQNGMSWYVYAELLEKANRVEETEYAYLRSITLEPENKEVWLDYTHFLSLTHSPRRAAEITREALNVFPDDEGLLYRLVAYQLNAGMKQLALENLEIALNINFEGHEDMLSYYPDALKHHDIAEMLEIYRKNEF